MVPADDLNETRPRRIYLAGFMGSGKSTVGRALARRLGWPFVDMDSVIEDRAGMSIPEVFDRHGEEYFRDLETRVLRSLAERDPPLVVATGGGVPTREENRALMDESGMAILLRVDPKTAYDRIEGDEGRPKLGNFESFKELWSRRQDAYNSIPRSVDAARNDPAAVVEAVLECLDDDAAPS